MKNFIFLISLFLFSLFFVSCESGWKKQYPTKEQLKEMKLKEKVEKVRSKNRRVKNKQLISVSGVRVLTIDGDTAYISGSKYTGFYIETE